jgi:hypothetical protein
MTASLDMLASCPVCLCTIYGQHTTITLILTISSKNDASDNSMYGLSQGGAIGSLISVDSLSETPEIKTNLVRIHVNINASFFIPEYP